MPPGVALILCCSLIGFAFALDFKRKPDVTNALWIPLLWMMIVGSRFVSQWIEIGSGSLSASGIEEGSPIDRMVFGVLLLSGAIVLMQRRVRTSELLGHNKWLLVWFIYCGVSIGWSDFPDIAFKRYVKGFGTVIMVLVVLTEPNPLESLRTLVRRCGYVLLPLSLLFIKYYRNIGVGFDEWTGQTIYVGVALNKNTLGRLTLVCAFFFFWTLITVWRDRRKALITKEWWLHALFFVLSVWLLRLTDSATSIGVLFAGILAFVAFEMPVIKRNRRQTGVIILASILLFLMLDRAMGITEFLVVEVLGRNMTFTDRAYLWKDLLNMGTNPIWGAGYDSFWLGHRLDILWERYRWQPTESHNGYLETYLELGVVGLVLLAGCIIAISRNIEKTLVYDFELGRFRLAFLLMVLLYNLTEASFKGITLMWLMFLLISVDAWRSGNRSASRNMRGSFR